MRAFFTITIAGALTASACGHGVPALVTTQDGALALLGQMPVGEFEVFGSDIETEDPGFGVNLVGTAPPVGTRIGIETVGGLLFWDGTDLVPTAATLTLEAPEFDSLGNANSTTIEEYAITEATPPLTGMHWSRYPGGSFWDAHGYYTLADSTAAGLYGVPLRLVDLAPGSTLGPSEPFTLPLLLGSLSTEQRQAGLEAFAALLTEQLVGDYDADGTVDANDYTRWRDDYGLSVATPRSGSDGNGDGFVDAADYTVWRDAASNPTTSALPEPTAIKVIATSLILGFLLRRNHSQSNRFQGNSEIS